MPVHPLELAIALAVIIVAAGLQSLIGFGLAAISVPLLAAIDPLLAPVPQLLVALPLSVAMLALEHRHVDLRGVGWVLAGRVPGAVAGGLILVTFNARAANAAIALVILAVVVILATGATLRRSPTTQFVAGIASGISGLVASIGGPALALLYREEKGATLRSSLAAVFIIGIGISIITRAVTGEIRADEMVIAAYFLPAAALGLVAGRQLTGRFDGAPLRRVVLAVSSMAALILLIQAFSF